MTFLIFLWFVSNNTAKHINVQCLFEIEDWVINSEWETWQTAQQQQHGTWQQLHLFMCQQRLDHFLSPSRARLTIVSGLTVSHDIVHGGAVQFNYQLQAQRWHFGYFWIRLPENPSKRIVKWVTWYALPLPLGFHFHLHAGCFVTLLHLIVF